jgi:uncharacterized iron-regulated protein
MNHSRVVAGFLAFAVLLGGCASSRTRGVEAAAALPADARSAVKFFDGRGQRVEWSAMRSAAAGADVLVIGETHGHALGLEAAACLFDDILADGRDAALLLEFIERDEQVAVDDYLAGVTDEAGFRAAAGRNEGNYPPGHARMLEAARAAGRPVYAANAPRRYVRMTTSAGYEKLAGLTRAQRRLFAIPDPLVEGRYRDDFFALMSGMSHGPAGTEEGTPPDMVEKMYRSQQMWDATMAESVVSAVRAGDRPAVLVVGRFHSDFDGGTVQLIRRAAPELNIVTVSMVASAEPTLSPDDLGRADFVVYTGGE